VSGGGPRERQTIVDRIQQALVLALLFAMLYAATRAVPQAAGALSSVAGIGFLLLAGTLASELLEPLRVPHLTAYIVAGIVAGPYGLHLLDHDTVVELSKTNSLALALIALAGGAELRLADLRKTARSLAWSTLFQTVFTFVAIAALFFAFTSFLPFARELPATERAAVSLLWGVVAITRSPSATLAVLSQTRANGPLAQTTLATVMVSDVVVLVVLAVTLTLVRPLLEPGATLSMTKLVALGHELLGSVSLGTTLGLVLVVYLRFIGRQLLVVLLLLGFGFTEVLKYLHFEPLLTFLVAGFIVQNLSSQGEKFLHVVERISGVVFVVFFAGAGAHLDVPILRSLGPIALALCGGRIIVSWLANRVSARVADDPPVLRRWGWIGLVSQAGVALGVGAIIERNLPGALGSAMRALVIATVAINEVVGPVMFKTVLDRQGESRPHE
jgi:Kef-type K+ transport system membrane component KefB